MAIAVRGVLRDGMVGRKTGLGPDSVPIAGQLPIRPAAPAALTISATARTEQIVLAWSAPTKDAAGAALNAGAVVRYNVYRSASAAIDITNSTTYAAKVYVDSEGYTYNTGSSSYGPWYFVVTAVDVDRGESAASNEVSATASVQAEGVDVDDIPGGNASILVGRGRIGIRFEPRSTAWAGFSHYKTYFDVNDGGGWTATWTEVGTGLFVVHHVDLDITHAYKYKTVVVGKDLVETTGTTNDNGGAGYTPNEADQGLILADLIAAQHIVAEYDMTARTFIGGVFQSANWAGNTGSQWDADNGVIKLGGSTTPGVYADATGNFRLGGAAGPLTFDNSIPTSPELVVRATFKTSTSGKRIEIPGSGTDQDEILAYDSANKIRSQISDGGMEVWNASGPVSAAKHTAYFPSLTGTNAHIKHEQVLMHHQAIIGQTTGTTAPEHLVVAGGSRLGGDVEVTGALTVAAHSATGTIAQVVNLAYGTGSAPTGTVAGTVFFQYVV
jgi:hypothetical protein